MNNYQKTGVYLAIGLLLAACTGGQDRDRDELEALLTPPSDPAPIATSFPVMPGEVGMIATNNPRQQPFACQTFNTVLGQPQVDNYIGVGYPVTKPGDLAPQDHGSLNADKVIGYSADCGAPTQINYFYLSNKSQRLRPLEDPTALSSDLPPDMAQVTIDGERVNAIVRHEIGTLNRFIYSIALLTPNPGANNTSATAEPDLSAWNGDLVFHFGGGGNPGYTQSAGDAIELIAPDGRGFNLALISRGYALATSTGTATDTTLDIALSGQTAQMVKQQFAAAYGAPRYTYGFGISGGAVQQQLYEQNIPELLDALIPVDTFGDTVTGFNSYGDCELLEFYFDRVDAKVNGSGSVNDKWKDWENRQHIQGFNARNNVPTRFDDGSGRPIGSIANPGSSECIEGQRGSIPLMANPHFIVGQPYDLIRQMQPEVFEQTRFSLFENLAHVFGRDSASGYAHILYDNVGVQYGLKALRNGDITVDEFLLINAHVGGFKNPSEFVAEGYPFNPNASTEDIDPWSSRNSTARDYMIPGAVAPRTEGNLEAMQAAYESGMVFGGRITAPLIIIDAYMEPALDQHHSHEKFEIRQRMLEANGHADNLVIWTVDGEHENVLPLMLKALELHETWLDGDSRPAEAQDACFTAEGDLIYSGADAYRGALTRDTADDGPCLREYPIYGSSRSVAGDELTGYTLKCQLQSVTDALNNGTYGTVNFSEFQEARLKEIFANGVCNFSVRDRARPDDF